MVYIYLGIYVYIPVRYSEFQVNMRYNLQPVLNKLTLCIKRNSIFLQAVSSRCSAPTLH